MGRTVALAIVLCLALAAVSLSPLVIAKPGGGSGGGGSGGGGSGGGGGKGGPSKPPPPDPPVTLYLHRGASPSAVLDRMQGGTTPIMDTTAPASLVPASDQQRAGTAPARLSWVATQKVGFTGNAVGISFTAIVAGPDGSIPLPETPMGFHLDVYDADNGTLMATSDFANYIPIGVPTHVLLWYGLHPPNQPYTAFSGSFRPRFEVSVYFGYAVVPPLAPGSAPGLLTVYYDSPQFPSCFFTRNTATWTYPSACPPLTPL